MHMADAFLSPAVAVTMYAASAAAAGVSLVQLRSMDRAQALYESMELRGFSGEFPGAVRGRGSAASWPYALVCPVLMLLARYFDLSALLGGLFV